MFGTGQQAWLHSGRPGRCPAATVEPAALRAKPQAGAALSLTGDAQLAGRRSKSRRPLEARVPPLRREVILLVTLKSPAQGQGDDAHGGHRGGGHGGRYREANGH